MTCVMMIMMMAMTDLFTYVRLIKCINVFLHCVSIKMCQLWKVLTNVDKVWQTASAHFQK